MPSKLTLKKLSPSIGKSNSDFSVYYFPLIFLKFRKSIFPQQNLKTEIYNMKM